MKNNIFFTLTLLFTASLHINAQDLLEKLDTEYPEKTQYEISTFKATRLAIGQSIENRKKGVLQLMSTNRSWNIPNSRLQSFIADKTIFRVGLEYGITDKLTTGGGWSSEENVYDGYLKYNLFRQRKNSKSSISATLFQNISIDDELVTTNFSNKLAATSQILIARKFTPEFSVQITPTFVYRNLSNNVNPSSQFAIGFGGRYKIKPHVSVVSEYYHVANPIDNTYGAFGVGINWDVRYLMLQFHMTNARSMVEDRFITKTPNNFNSDDGNFVFGFNAIFTIHTR